MVATLLLLAATIVVLVTVNQAVLVSRLDERLEQEMIQEVDEFRRIAGGIDPNTGEPFHDDVAAIFEEFFSRNVPGDDEVILSLYQGSPFLRSAGANYPIEELHVAVREWAAIRQPTFGSVDTPEGELRTLTVPVQSDQGDVLGTFVVGVFPAYEQAQVRDAIQIAVMVGALTFAVAAMVAWAIAGRVLSPLRALAVATRSIHQDDLSHRIAVQGTGELAELTTNFNAMIDRVDDAVTSQRAFLDDAGHELRTPITIIQGHLELIEPDGMLDAETRSLVLDELERMQRIVEDLLTMAKSEQPDFVVPAPVDLVDVTMDVMAKARPMADRDWKLEANAVVVAEWDRQRIIQAWMNLVRNAVQHTEDGDTITVFSRHRDDCVELGVADNGEGVSEQDRERIFTRFGRGTSGRRTRGDGAGLGLAIVAAVAEAHGGSVRLEPSGSTFTPSPTSAQHRGAIFVITLPIEPPPSLDADELTDARNEPENERN